MKKRLWSLALAICLVLGFLPTASVTAKATDHTDHPVCGDSNCTSHGDTIGDWQAVTDTLPTTPGNYYLTADVTRSETWTVPAGNIVLCLNGHTIKTSSGSVISVGSGANLTITDCNGSNSTHKFSVNGTTGLWTLNEGGTESLTGGVITGGTCGTGGGVYVNGGTFTMYGGNIVGNTASSDGGGVYAGGTFNMYGGSITGNTASGTGADGGGVSVNSGGTFNMTGGSIAGNYATIGGGVCVYNTFTMSGGSITGNYATIGGGGVYVFNAFNMSGGSITHNSAKSGGGVYISSSSGASFTMSDGEITGNSASANGGGVCLYGTFTVSGSPEITGNTGFKGNNVYLGNKTITVTGALTSGAKIGVSLYEYDGSMEEYVPTTGTFTSGGIAATYINYFFSDNTGYLVSVDDSTKELKLGNHAHKLKSTDENATEFTKTTATLYDSMSEGNYVLTADVELESTWTPTKNITLDLNGYTVSLKSGKTGSVIQVNGGVTLTIYDCNSTDTTHYGKWNADYTTYTIYASNKNLSEPYNTLTGGLITGGNVTSGDGGGGVYVKGGTFNLYSGNIAGNKVTASGGTGGGVNAINYSDAFAVFNMYGGTITGNMAPNGGAVYTGANIKFTMTGGLITGNVTGKSDDRNTKPTYGAVECPGGAAISGTPQIFGNIWKKDGSELNLYLSNGAAKISVGALTGDASIGVTMAYADTFTTGWNTANSKTPITVFTSDNTKYVVRLNSDSELELHAHDWSDWTVTTAATCLAAGSENRTCSVCGDEETQSIPKLDHSYTYTADGAKITETCSNGCGHSATATVIAPADTTYNGKAIEATVNYSNNWVGQKPEIDYGEHGNVDPGNVTASITVDGVTASVTYTIVREIVPTVVTTPNKNKPAADTENDADENTDDDTVLRVDIPAEAVERGETVILSQSLTAGDTVEITTPGEVTVEIPVENVSATTVAVLVSDDGTEEILKTAKLTDDGLLVTISGDATVQIKDNKKKFVDVADGYWGETAIYFNAAREIFNGTSANTFSPENDTTRQMLMTVLARLSGVNTGSGYDIGMAWAMENNISDGSNPTNTITREQLATMLWRYVGSPDSTLEELDFVDADEVSAYAEEAVRWAVETGILAGKGNGILDPKGNASRAQVAQMLMNFINKQ